ncbi:hypothetical protein [Nostoc sp.]|uniref:hypothetical protein n=1 Tax=Nostoc sp. TaxID=1180 RepID=UPI002FF7C9C6
MGHRGDSAVGGFPDLRRLASWGRSYQCPTPMPVAPRVGAAIPLQTPGDGVSRRFQ